MQRVCFFFNLRSIGEICTQSARKKKNKTEVVNVLTSSKHLGSPLTRPTGILLCCCFASSLSHPKHMKVRQALNVFDHSMCVKHTGNLLLSLQQCMLGEAAPVTPKRNRC